MFDMFDYSKDEKQKIYSAYLAIFSLPFEIQRKNTMLTALMGGAKWSWRVIGITPDALKLLESNNYKYIKGKICRAHLIDRIDTAYSVFEISQPLSEDKFFKVIWENDKTVIAQKSENKNVRTLPRIHINYKLGLFEGKPVSFKHGKKETEFLRKLHADYKSKVEK